MKKNVNQYIIYYLSIVFVVSWTILISYMVFAKYHNDVIEPLAITHPLVIFILYLPSITGLSIYASMGGVNAIKRLLLKFIPRRQDLFWFPVIFITFLFFWIFIRYGSIWLNVSVPKITYTIPQLIKKALWNFIAETGLLGGILGWVAFLLPALQAKFKSNIKGALLTGFIFGLWVLPGYNISSVQATTSYLLYVIQLMAFMLFASYIFNATRGTLIFYLFAFWLAASGSYMQLYFFNIPAQALEFIYLSIAAVALHFVFKRSNINNTLQIFPDFIYETSQVIESRSFTDE